METQEIFRVFDACQPSVAQVRAYLERISGLSPFDLIFSKNGKETITDKIGHGQGELVGIVIDKTIFYAKGLGKHNKENIVSCQDVFAFGQTLHPKAIPMNFKTLDILRKNINEYYKLTDMLQVFGYQALPLQNYYLLIEKSSDCRDADYYDLCGDCGGNSTISNFLKFDNIFFCASL